MPQENNNTTEQSSTPTTEQSSEQSTLTDNGIDKDISDLMAYDPFEVDPALDAKQGKKEGETATPPAKPGDKNNAASDKPNPAAEGATGQPATNTGGDGSLEHWKQLADEYKRLYEGGKPSDKTAAADDKDKPKAPAFNFAIEDQLLQAIGSEDVAERKNGIKFLADGVANAVHQKVIDHIESTVQKLTEEVLPQRIQSYIQETTHKQAVFQDFYGTYKELNRKEYHPLIKTVAAMVAKEKGYTQYNQQMKKDIADRAYALLNLKREEAAAGNGAAPQHPALSGGNNSRPTVQVSESDDIVNTLGF